MEEGLEQLNQVIANMIKECREESGLNQKDLAQMIGSDQSLISRLESRDHGSYDLNTLYRIFDKLNIELVVEFYEKE